MQYCSFILLLGDSTPDGRRLHAPLYPSKTEINGRTDHESMRLNIIMPREDILFSACSVSQLFDHVMVWGETLSETKQSTANISLLNHPTALSFTDTYYYAVCIIYLFFFQVIEVNTFFQITKIGKQVFFRTTEAL